MTVYIENMYPGIRDNNLNTQKAVTMESTLAVTGTLTASGAVNVTGQVAIPNAVFQQTITDVDAQNATPTIAQILGGVITHNSKTGAGTVTVPLGSDMSTGVTGVAVGSTIKWLYYNRGNQTATITAASGHTLVGGTAAVTTGKWMPITSVCTAANTWVSYLTTLN